ncbi:MULTISPECIES: DUF72 domain-containing protein [Gracilimonas]|uniref:DUF72 domain-containing protein n=1 Tax=Gracilimonas sediminicola TaxID=2952158 RepID=A0A9X2L128_9BACT|nr:DUF72 domain-containing protein [Gracilimonas sediminicola]MCP9290295.1 DUF72 domain-containing protein [Gracilimonas sediminicola]
MKFGKVDNPGEIDFSLPPDHPDTLRVLNQKGGGDFDAYVGCAKWNKKDLKGFYPRGTKDELEYYSRQFNSIELNATFYGNKGPEQSETWAEKTPDNFKFFPKVVNTISHFKRLKNIEAPLEEYLHGMRGFGDQLEMIFLQLRDDFKPKDFDRIQRLVEIWPDEIPLAIELRHTDWYNDAAVASQVYQLFEENGVANIITDTAGRRDLLHMRLTSPAAFIRYVGANHTSDYDRLDDWVERLKFWKEQGLEKLYFFVHQNLEKESPMLSKHFIKAINKELGTNLDIPGEAEQGDLGL